MKVGKMTKMRQRKIDLNYNKWSRALPLKHQVLKSLA